MCVLAMHMAAAVSMHKIAEACAIVDAQRKVSRHFWIAHRWKRVALQVAPPCDPSGSFFHSFKSPFVWPLSSCPEKFLVLSMLLNALEQAQSKTMTK